MCESLNGQGISSEQTLAVVNAGTGSDSAKFRADKPFVPLITHHNRPSRAHFRQTRWFHKDASVSLRPANYAQHVKIRGTPEAHVKPYVVLGRRENLVAPALCAAGHSGPFRRQAFWPRAAPPQLRARGFFGRSSLTTLFGPASKHTARCAMQSQRESVAKQLGGTGVRLHLTSATHH